VADAIKIRGLAEFNRNLKKLDNDLPKALRLALNEAANVVVEDAAPKIPRRSGRAQKALRARSTSTTSRVIAGSARARYLPWLDFGGEGRKRGRPAKREFIKKGRYVYPTYYAKRDSGEFGEVLNRSLLDVVRRAGIAVD
jgi:hypothetical protein